MVVGRRVQVVVGEMGGMGMKVASALRTRRAKSTCTWSVRLVVTCLQAAASNLSDLDIIIVGCGCADLSKKGRKRVPWLV